MKIANSFKSSTTIAYVGKKISQFSEKDVSVVHQNLMTENYIDLELEHLNGLMIS